MAEVKRRGRPPKKKLNNEVVEEAMIEESPIEETVEETVTEQETVESKQTESQSNDDEIFGTGGNYNPYSQDVIEREYATPKTAEGLTDDIPEPDFNNNPSFEDLMNDTKADEEEQPSPFDNPNPAFNDLPPQEKQIACEQMVDTVLDTYESLHLIAQKFVKFSEDDLNELIINDEIDPNTVIPTEDGDISLKEFVASYNEQASEVMAYDRGFGHKVRPAMVRVFMKKGWSMTDEQFLLFAIGKDLLTKTTQFIGLKKSINNTFTLLKDMHSENQKVKSSRRSNERQYDFREERFAPQPERVQYQEAVPTEQPLNYQNEQEEFVVTEKTNFQTFEKPKEADLPPMMKEIYDEENEKARQKLKNDAEKNQE
jgi:hypothetical protein